MLTVLGVRAEDVTIGSTADWDAFASRVNNGEVTLNGILTADITVSTMVGTNDHYYKGDFNGQGHTLTVSYGSAGNPFGEEVVAPFRYVSCDKGQNSVNEDCIVTIQNLTVRGDIYTSNKFAGSVVGKTHGVWSPGLQEIHLVDCHSYVSIHSTVNGDGTHGGLVAVTDDHQYILSLERCSFNGKFLGENTHSCGGLVGWVYEYITPKISNCLFDPEEVTFSTNNSSTLARLQSSKKSKIDNCQYTQTFGNEQGSQVYKERPDGLSAYLESVNGKKYYMSVSINGLLECYNLQSETISYELKAANGVVLTDGTDYQVTYTDSNNNETTSVPTASGAYTMTFTGLDGGGAAGSTTRQIFIIDMWNEGAGTEGDPYIIRTVDDMNKLSSDVNNGWNTSGVYFKLANDIVFGDGTGRGGFYTNPSSADNGTNFTPIGGSAGGKKFRGVFDGDGHTISGYVIDINKPYDVNDKELGAKNIGLFGYVEGGTIKKLKIDKAFICGNHDSVGGIVGYLDGGTIDSCYVGSDVVVKVRGWVCDGQGGVAGGMGSGTISNCTSSVTINQFDVTDHQPKYAGGIVGVFGHGNLTGNLVLNANISIDYDCGAIVGLRGFSSGVTDATLSNNCYYNTTIRTKQGGEATSNIGSNPYNGSVADVTDNNGAVQARSTLVSESVVTLTSSEKAVILRDGICYYTGAVEDQLTLTIEEGLVPVFTVTATDETLNYTIESGKYKVQIPANQQVVVGGQKIIDLEGNGSEATPYLISNLADWQKLVQKVSEGEPFEGRRFRQTGDVNWLTEADMLGTAETPFAGIFDGNGYEIIAQFGASNGYLDTEVLAPFRYTRNATFNNLWVKGSIYTQRKFAGGIVGKATKDATFNNCRSSVEIFSQVEGDGTHGGLVAYNNDQTSFDITFTNCWFDGKLMGETTNSCGGFVGYIKNKNNARLTNCLFIPAEVTMSGEESSTFVRGSSGYVKLKQAYYLTPFGAEQGTHVYIAAPAEVLTTSITAANQEKYYADATVTIKELQEQYQPVESLSYSVTSADDELMTRGEDYIQTVRNSNNEVVTALDEGGTYTITITAKDGGRCFGQTSVSITTYSLWPGQGRGSEDDPYIIANVDDFKQFVAKVNERWNSDYGGPVYEYKDRYFKQTADIDFSNETKDENGCNFHTYTYGNYGKFCGHYNGAGHTISGIVTRVHNTDGTGVFGNVSEGSIENLTIDNSTFIDDNTTYNYGQRVGPFCGYLLEGATIENCRSTSSVKVLAKGGVSYHGGIVGHAGSNTTVRNCVSQTQLLLAEGAEAVQYMEYFGGIAGYAYKSTLENNLYLGGKVEAYDFAGSIVGTFTESTLKSNFYYNDDQKGVGSYKDNTAGTSYDVYGACRAMLMQELPSGVGQGDYIKYGVDYYVRAGALYDYGANNALIAANKNDNITSFTLNGRTLVKDGQTWNTLCLPFDVTINDAEDLRGAEVRTLSSASFNSSTGSLTLNFSEPVTTIEAGKPYIAKLTDGLSYSQYNGRWNAAFFDGDITNNGYIYGENNYWNCVYKASGAFDVTGYRLYYPGNDFGVPKKWVMMAKLNDTDPWIEIDSRDAVANSEDAIPQSAGAFGEYTLAADKRGKYRYFHLRVSDVSSSASGQLRLAEIVMLGDTKNQQVIEPTFSNVAITATEPIPVTSGPVTFTGIYEPLVFSAGTAHNDVLYLGAGNMLYYPNGDGEMSINAFRSYFALNGITVGDPSAPNGIKGFNLLFDGEETAIDSGLVEKVSEPTDTHWYTIDGRRLQAQPTQPGIYIRGGKKIVIRKQ